MGNSILLTEGKASLVIDYSVFERNFVHGGSLFSLDKNNTFSMSNTTIQNNTCIDGYIFNFLNYTLVRIQRSNLELNEVFALIFSRVSCRLTITQTNVKNNNRGNIITAVHSTTIVQDSTFAGNTALMKWGGLFVADMASYILINGCNFTKNSAGQGAAAFIKSSKAQIYNSVFSWNDATKGGAIACYGGTIELYNCIIEYNSATVYGGAVYVMDAITAIKAIDVTFKENRCEESGGALYLGGENIDTVIDNCTFLNNHAQNYGSVMSFSTNVVRIASTQIMSTGNNDFSASSPPGKPMIHSSIFTYKSVFTYGDITLNTSQRTFLSEMMKRNFLTVERDMTVRQKETPFASGND